jgi:hypothetical protein
MHASFQTLYLFYNCYLFWKRIGRIGGKKRKNFCTVVGMNICNDACIHPPPPQFFLFHTTFYIDTFRVSPMISPIASPLSESPPLSLETSLLLRPSPLPPHNFHTLNEIKDLCNMQTDRRTEIACALIIIIRGAR